MDLDREETMVDNNYPLEPGDIPLTLPLIRDNTVLWKHKQL